MVWQTFADTFAHYQRVTTIWYNLHNLLANRLYGGEKKIPPDIEGVGKRLSRLSQRVISP